MNNTCAGLDAGDELRDCLGLIACGLEAGQRVIVSNVPSAQPGRAIAAQPFDGKADSTPVPAQQNQGDGQQQAQGAQNAAQKGPQAGGGESGSAAKGANG